MRLEKGPKGKIINVSELKREKAKKNTENKTEGAALSLSECLEKIRHTVTINYNHGKLEFNLDTFGNGPNGGPCDCKDFEEFAICFETIEKAIKKQ